MNNNNNLNIDEFTKELIRKGEVKQPSSDFTKKVMSRILKDPAVNIHFITHDDRRSNIWLVLSMSIMLVGFFIFYFLKYGFDFSQVSDSLNTPSYIKAFADLFTKFWNELSLSPYILIALIGVVFLLLIDRTIVKYLYSI